MTIEQLAERMYGEWRRWAELFGSSDVPPKWPHLTTVQQSRWMRVSHDVADVFRNLRQAAITETACPDCDGSGYAADSAAGPVPCTNRTFHARATVPKQGNWEIDAEALAREMFAESEVSYSAPPHQFETRWAADAFGRGLNQAWARKATRAIVRLVDGKALWLWPVPDGYEPEPIRQVLPESRRQAALHGDSDA